MRRRFAEGRAGALIWQAIAGALLALLAWALAERVGAELAARGIRSGFAFLAEPAGFDIGESLVPFHAGQPYWQAFLVGLGNTLRAALPGLLLATVVGLLVGLARLSPNALLRGLGTAYVELFRNVPLLLQLLTWYFLLTEKLPAAAEALELLPGLFLSKSGLALPFPGADGLEWPQRGGFAIEGGAALTPEYLAVLLGISAYAAAYLAEIVRAGIRSVPAGQVAAADALGLAPHQRLRWVVLPQALRLMVPPAASQYLNLVKNSSLAVVVGYPDLVSVANTSLNQTGQAVECIAVLIAVYLLLSLALALVMGRYNAALLRRGR
ncbi:MAG: ABC transporter permease subunit [Rhodocyclaceae bacterium]